ncbi:hypothetical protein [Bacillus methanolicus]|nr:hypothetical protein [Bacillus methanolicus]EIJ80917.1 hypothetical protein MGA3_11500 [Bacillus methanolicus MGA3]
MLQKPFPIIDVTELGSWVQALAAPNANLRTDIPKRLKNEIF